MRDKIFAQVNFEAGACRDHDWQVTAGISAMQSTGRR